MRILSCRAVCGLLLLSLAAAEVAVAQQQVDPDHAQRMTASRELFTKDVRTVLIGRCLKCHGGEESEGEFSLLTRETLLAGGSSGKAIDLKEASQSLLVKLIRHEEEPVMPEDGAKLDQRQIDAIVKWIELGAAYDKPLRDAADDEDPTAWTRRTIDPSARQFWSLEPLTKVEPPINEQDDWGSTPVDQFILADLRAAGIEPNPMASRRDLLRRAYFDLIGLPPSPEEVEAFVNDDDPQAYPRLVDRLLDNKHHGERAARHWLDAARFGESHGFEQDYDRPHAYHFRDFVIKAFNADLPFDDFVRWQLAGDEIEPDNPLAMMATGFLGAGVFPTQLTEKEFESSRYDELDDMVATMGTAMLGMTIGCARCHDHKFDPIPSRDYYRLVSAFRSTIRSNVEIELDREATAAAIARWESEREPLQKALEEFEKQELPKRFDQFLSSQQVESPADDADDQAADWIILTAAGLQSKQGASFERQEDGSYLASGKNANFDSYVFEAETALSKITALRLEALADKSMKKKGPGRAGNGNFGLSRISLSVAPIGSADKPESIVLQSPQVSFEQNAGNLSIAGSLDDNPKTGWAVDPKFGKDHAATFELEKPVHFAEGTRLVVRLEFNVNKQHNIGRLRLAVSSSGQRPALDADAITQQAAEQRMLKQAGDSPLTDARRQLLINVFKRTDPQWQQLNDRLVKHQAAKPRPVKTTAMVSSEGVKPIPHHGDGRGFPHFYEDAYFLNRGDVNQKQGVAEVGFLQALLRGDSDDEAELYAHWMHEPPQDSKTSYRRRAVADWITDTELGAGHLLARVIVNRLWQQHMGTGIVSTANDFGFQGQRPTHPELLDWLAGQLIENEWRLKPIRRLIMTSSVYRQSAHYDDAKAAVDPDNRLLWRFHPRRLEAEIIRDAMLAVSGELDETPFGPGTLDESMRRRSIYFMIKRSKLIPFLQVFDAPEPLASVGSRPSTTIAPQALIFLNNQHVREYCKSFAMRLLAETDGSIESAVERGYLSAVARRPIEAELAASVAFVEQQMSSYKGDDKADAQMLAVADLCQVLMSLNEFVYVN